jgi:hypothetical protein
MFSASNTRPKKARFLAASRVERPGEFGRAG